MKTYELLYLISSQVGQDELEAAKKDIETLIRELEGVIFKSEKSAPQTFSYRIKGHSSGHYLLVEFQAKEESILEVKQKITKDKRILRHTLLVKKPVRTPKARSLRRPFRTEETPAYPTEKPAEEKKGEKVEIEELSKKLDEILSE